jgi:hypothetical protein
VVGWQWDQTTREVKAVRMVQVATWQWQYWQSCEWRKSGSGSDITGDSGATSGSGWVAVGRVDSGGRCGSNGTS